MFCLVQERFLASEEGVDDIQSAQEKEKPQLIRMENAEHIRDVAQKAELEKVGCFREL